MKLEDLLNNDKWSKVFNILTEKQKSSLIKYIENIDVPPHKLPKNLYNVCLYDRDCFDYEKRMQDIKLLKRDSVSKKSFVLRYGKIEGEKRHKKRIEGISYKSSKDYLSNKFGENEFLKMRRSISKKLFIKKHGETKGLKLWDDYKKRFRNSHSLKGYIEKYGEIKGKELYEKKILKYKKTNGIEGYKEKHGDNWKNIWNEKNRKIKFGNSKAGYIEKYGEENGLKIMKKIKGTLSKPAFIKRFGRELGEKKYFEHCEYMSEKAKKEDWILHFNSENFYSKISQELFWLLEDKLTPEERNRSMFGSKNKEYFIRDKNSIYFFDYKINNKFIEFDGDYWHNRECSKHQDIIKNNILYKKGFYLLRIKECDFRNNPNKIIDKCLNFIRNEK